MGDMYVPPIAPMLESVKVASVMSASANAPSEAYGETNASVRKHIM